MRRENRSSAARAAALDSLTARSISHAVVSANATTATVPSQAASEVAPGHHIGTTAATTRASTAMTAA